MVCDTFTVNILLVSPDKKWITAGTKDNDYLSPKVCLVVFDDMVSFLLPASVCSLCFLITSLILLSYCPIVEHHISQTPLGKFFKCATNICLYSSLIS